MRDLSDFLLFCSDLSLGLISLVDTRSNLPVKSLYLFILHLKILAILYLFVVKHFIELLDSFLIFSTNILVDSFDQQGKAIFDLSEDSIVSCFELKLRVVVKYIGFDISFLPITVVNKVKHSNELIIKFRDLSHVVLNLLSEYFNFGIEHLHSIQEVLDHLCPKPFLLPSQLFPLQPALYLPQRYHPPHGPIEHFQRFQVLTILPIELAINLPDGVPLIVQFAVDFVELFDE